MYYLNTFTHNIASTLQIIDKIYTKIIAPQTNMFNMSPKPHTRNKLCPTCSYDTGSKSKIKYSV